MVSWQVFTRIAFRVAEQKGAQFAGIEDGGDFMSQLSEVWQQDKAEIKQMTEQQAENYLEGIVSA